ncbi:MAG: hypothetical protein KDE53_04725, partial [Caldilineaceae bacterium]|nr:hypothetical protein [Caldilineaceae bacterium]
QRDGSYADAVTSELPASPRAYLLLIHGTFSSTAEGFGNLFRSSGWEDLYDEYQGRLYAFNHRSLSQSPVQNALELLKLLPRDARLHIITHSRGGLVGELLCLHEITPAHLAPFHKGSVDRSREIAALQELSDLLVEKHLTLDRFVRVACPARGTLLAARRFDRYLSVLLSLAEHAIGKNLFTAYLKSTILQLIQQRADPAQLPGIEAMMPESPLIAMLNRYGMECNADLAVVAGDCQAGNGILNTLKVLASDVYYREDHDLVVNTAAMYGGAARRHGGYFWFERGAEVNHFSYFANPTSRRKILAWLRRKEDEVVNGFEEINFRPLAPALLRGATAPRTDAPTVILIPALFGSHLQRGEKQIWFDPTTLATGGLAALALDHGDEPVQATGLIGILYQELHQYLERDFRVLAFPYDWRLPLEESAEALAELVGRELDRSTQPVHLLAHAAGGLIARAMIAAEPKLWRRLTEQGGRLVMAGTAHGGSYTALDLLCGQAPVVRLLDLIDPDWEVADIVKLLGSFGSVYALLPHERGGWEEQWQKSTAGKWIHAARRKKWLTAAQRFWQTLRPAVDPEHMQLIVGAAPWTPSAVMLDDGDELRFQGVVTGDGWVT